ncbi:hypothetical protein, partial [Streptomyces alkaliterrae]
MANFRYSPEWQQAADRHSQLVDPVLTVRKLTRFDTFTNRHPARFDNAHVYATSSGTYETYMPPQRPQLAGRGYTAVYEVDIGVHRVRAELDLPSDNDAFEFGADVDLTWQVVTPEVFVASGHRNVPGLLFDEIQRRARPVTRGFDINNSAEAERALIDALTASGPLAETVGLRVDHTVRLRRDRASIDHQKNLQAIGHVAAEAVLSTQEGIRYDAVVDERVQQQLRQQHAQAMLSGQHQLEQQALEAKKIEFYQYHLSQGGVAAWAMHLAQHPEDSRLVMQSLREDQLRLIQSQLGVVTQVLTSEHTELHHLAGVHETAIEVVRGFLAQQLPGAHGAPGAPGAPPQIPGAAPAQPYPAGAQGAPGVPPQVPGGPPVTPYAAPGPAPGPGGPYPPPQYQGAPTGPYAPPHAPTPYQGAPPGPG